MKQTKDISKTRQVQKWRGSRQTVTRVKPRSGSFYKYPGRVTLSLLLVTLGLFFTSMFSMSLAEAKATVFSVARSIITPFDHPKNNLKYVKLRRLMKGVDPLATDQRGNTPVHVAAQYGLAKEIGDLKERGADLNKRNQDGATPIGVAIVTFNFHTVEALLKNGACLDEAPVYWGRKWTPLYTLNWRSNNPHLSAEGRHRRQAIRKSILDVIDNPGELATCREYSRGTQYGFGFINKNGDRIVEPTETVSDHPSPVAEIESSNTSVRSEEEGMEVTDSWMLYLEGLNYKMAEDYTTSCRQFKKAALEGRIGALYHLSKIAEIKETCGYQSLEEYDKERNKDKTAFLNDAMAVIKHDHREAQENSLWFHQERLDDQGDVRVALSWYEEGTKYIDYHGDYEASGWLFKQMALNGHQEGVEALTKYDSKKCLGQLLSWRVSRGAKRI